MSGFVYLAYRKIDNGAVYMNDFNIKFGYSHNVKQRKGTLATTYCLEGLQMKKWKVQDPKYVESEILDILESRDYLRFHSGDKRSETISLKIPMNLKVSEVVNLYNRHITILSDIIDKFISRYYPQDSSDDEDSQATYEDDSETSEDDFTSEDEEKSESE